jgi:hypothetical protein
VVPRFCVTASFGAGVTRTHSEVVAAASDDPLAAGPGEREVQRKTWGADESAPQIRPPSVSERS